MNLESRAPMLSAVLLGELARLPDDASRTKFFGAHGRLVHEGVVEQLAEAVRERVRVDVHEAAALSDAAVMVAGRIESEEAMARALRAKANAHWFKNELKPAVALFAEAVRLFALSGNDAERGRTLSSSIQSLILLGEYAHALEAAEQAGAIFEKLGDERRLARLEINIANIFHRQDRFAEALDRYERACERLLPFDDAEGVGVALHNMAVCLIVLNDFERALATYERARAHCAAAGMPVLVAQADYNIAYLYYFRGDYSRALELLRAARVACTQVGDLYHSALCNLDQSEVYLELNLSAEAAEMAIEGQALFERLGNGYEAARSVTNLAIALGQQGEAVRALDLFAQARSRFEREQNTVWPALIDLYQALVLVNQGRYFEARRLCVSALAFFRAADIRRKVVMCELLLARIGLGTGAPDEALEHCANAIDAAVGLGAPVVEYQAHFLKGQIEEARGDGAAAYLSYQEARTRLEALRSILWGEDLKIAFMTTKFAVYERLVDLCIRQGGDEDRTAHEIFGYIEQAKSRSLRDLFFERIQPMAAPDDGQSELVRQIRTLREELNWYYHRIEFEQLSRDEQSAGRLDTLQTQLQNREHTFIKVLRETPAGVRAAVGLHNAPAATPDVIRAALRRDTTIVEYFRTGDQILAAVLTLDDLRIVPLTTVSRVRHLIRMLQFQLAKIQFGPAYLAEIERWSLESTNVHLQELYAELFAPLPVRPGGHVVIVPHDVLHYVPFHALHDGRSYLVDSTDVSYAPSASIYALCCQRPGPSTGRSVVFGVPDERAPFIADEVDAVAGLVPEAEVRIGAAASVAELRSLCADARIVHVATHGRFREDNPLFSGIRLGDAYLTLHDLSGLRLSVDLVTLSGCATGLNVVAEGDELRGLVRGVLAAGARSLLVSLWDVHDRSTATFMTLFYKGLAGGLGKAAALRAAACELRREYEHPYYWAPFVLVGADRAG
jgi:CHAT domain-containing protein